MYLSEVEPLPETVFVPPRYSDAGRILVYLSYDGRLYRYNVEVMDYDGSAYWISEGEGFDYWMDRLDLDLPEPGWFVIEGITGEYVKGDPYGVVPSDDEVYWNFEFLRHASRSEIEAGALSRGIEDLI